MDLDLDDLGIDDGPSKASSRPSRFQPKSSKLRAKPKAEPVSEPGPQTLIPKNQEVPIPSLDSTFKTAFEPSPSSTFNDIAKPELEPKAEEAAEDPMEEDVDEDRVVREIDVFFTPPLDTHSQLYVMQYPLRPCWRPYELDERCEEVRVKPKSSQIEVDLSLNVDDNKSYNADVADNMRITKQTLCSKWKPPPTTGYAVGVLMGNKLHLNPVHAVVQLRPSMEHLKAGGLKKKSNVTQDVEVNVKSNEMKKETALKKQGKLVGTSNEQNTDDAESWVSLEYHGIDSSFSRKYLQKMAAQESSSIQFSMSPYDYVSSLCPGTSTDNHRAKGHSRRFLLSLPLEERLKTFLSEGPQVHRFNALKHLAPDESDEDVLGVLRRHADLVQGLWVTRSSLLCEGVQALARDYVLLLFSKNPLISYAQLDGTRFAKEIMKRVLNPLAVERPSFKNWKFKEPTDVSFIKGHPGIMREQERLWESREKKITDIMQGAGKGGPAMKNSLKTSMTNRPGASGNTDQGAKRSVNGTVSSEVVTMSDETREYLPRALLEVFRIHKVCSLQLIRQDLRNMAVSKSNFPKLGARAAVAAAHGASAPLPELQAVISQVAINVHGVYVLKSSLEHSDFDPLRSVIINLFCAKEPNATLKKADIVEAAKIALKRNITNNEFAKVINELCVSKGNAWCMKSGDGQPR